MARDEDIGRPMGAVGGDAVYLDTDTASDDTARRFKTTAFFLKTAVVQVQVGGSWQSFGDASSQTMDIPPSGYFELKDVDLSTLYFKNTNAGENGTVNIMGT
jgi:hypothetical protein